VKKVLKHLTGLLISCAVIYGAWIFMTSSGVPLPFTATIEEKASGSELVNIRVEKKIEEGEGYTVEYFLPTFGGSVSPLVIAKINNNIQNEITGIVSRFKEDNEKPFLEQKNTLSLSLQKYSVTQSRYLNIELVEFSYQAGAAHPLTYTHIYVYDLNKGEMVTLNGVFNKEVDYLSGVSNIVREKLKIQLSMKSIEQNPEAFLDASTTDGEMLQYLDTESILSTVFFEEGITPREDNFSEFSILDSGIEFVFGQYQVAPYVYGEQRVLISYAELENLLLPEFKNAVRYIPN